MRLNLTFSELSAVLDGQLSDSSSLGTGEQMVHGLSTDSRKITPHCLFLALEGQNFDGHDFIDQALGNGAIGVIGRRTMKVGYPYWQVHSGIIALGSIVGYAFRQQFSGTCIGITGSSGKTSVKEMLAAILSEAGVLASEGNHNNEIGVPLTLLRWTDEPTVVVEMGARKRRDIDWLCKVARPSIGVVTNAQQAHLGIFGSVENIVATKGELFSSLPPDGIAVMDLHSPYQERWKRMTKARIFTVGEDDVAANLSWKYAHSVCRLQYQHERIDVCLSMEGRHNAFNAALAVAAALCSGRVTLRQCGAALQRNIQVSGRMQWYPHAAHWILDDSYNASPDAFREAINVLLMRAQEKGLKSIVVMGDMLELGKDSTNLHWQIGHYAGIKGVDAMLCLGAHSVHAADAFNRLSGNREGRVFASREGMRVALSEQLAEGQRCAVLVKGSRGTEMESLLPTARGPVVGGSPEAVRFRGATRP